MGSAASAVPLWVLTAALLGAALGRQPFALCNTSCCTVLPSCGAAALRVSCNCSGASITLQRGDIPHSVLSISISHAKQVIIHEDAVNDLSQLTNFSIRYVDQVKISENGMALSANSKMRSVRFEGLKTLRIESNAFSGAWQSRASSIRIGRVSSLHMKPKALAYMTAGSGPSLDVWQVDMLHLSPGGLLAPLYYLKLNGVTMSTCNSKSFHGKIDSVTLNNVTINEAKPGCFNDLPHLLIQSSNFSTVETRAFVGSIQELIIKDTSFKQIKQMGFDIRTTTMKIATSYIENLFGNGISVQAKHKVILQQLRIDSLSKNALVGLNLRGSSHQTMEFTDLEVLHAEDGSLAFADCAEIRVSSLHLTPPYPRVCPTEKWVRQLTGAEPSGELSTAQYQIFHWLRGEHLCDEDRWTSWPKQRSGCETETRASDEDFVKYDDKWYEFEYVESGKEQKVDDYVDWQDQPDELPLKGGDGRRTVIVSSADKIGATGRPEETDDCVTISDSRCQSKTVEHSESIKERKSERNDEHETNTGSESVTAENDGLSPEMWQETISSATSVPSRITETPQNLGRWQHTLVEPAGGSEFSAVPSSGEGRSETEIANGGLLELSSKLQEESTSSPTGIPSRITDTSPNSGRQQHTLAEPGGEGEFSTVPSGGEGCAEIEIVHAGLLEHHQMLVFLVLGAVFTLAIVLLVSLLILVFKRRRAHHATPAPGGHILDLVASIPSTSRVDSGRTRPTSSGSEPALMEGHFYEEIREPSLGVPAFPAPLPPQPYQNIQNDRSYVPMEYERLLDR